MEASKHIGFFIYWKYESRKQYLHCHKSIVFFFHQYSYQICLLQLLYSMCAKSGLRLNDEPDLKLSYVGQYLVFVFGVVHNGSTDLIVLLDFLLTVKASPYECVIRTRQP